MMRWRCYLTTVKAGRLSAFPTAFVKTFQLSILGLCLHVPTVVADQTAAELPALFAQLEEAVDSNSARVLEEQIWQHWLSAPDSNSAHLMSQISTAMSAGSLDFALHLSNQLVDSNPDFAEAWNKRATIQYLLGNHAESVGDIRETVRLESRHFGAISGLGMIFLKENNLPAALQAFEQVLKISPASINAKRSVERVLLELEQEI